MTTKPICITTRDMERLRKLVHHPDLVRQRPYLERLERVLDDAVVAQADFIPADIVTMNSMVRLIDGATCEELILTLVYPSDACIPEGRISVLAPVGTAILGRRQGDTVEWDVPGGIRACRVDEILFQPEAAGQYSL